ncbi:N-acetylmuramoyl-L-alanine amidase [Pedobacter sp. SYSU D00535]|uniref:N-acetylmuramoyl-L-alanine amidase n=1 Tax=Pedobacter sp. SYSU D00535 TaxID=2810308 RepID=UPI001A96975B|nr:N-acetylmuramoyl-L-alanine amidase [Pedobacter sp. SYSU D00535]
MKKTLIQIIFISAFIYSCSSNPYAPANKIYRRQAKELTKSLREVPPVSTVGMPATHPAGTVNFNLRKPNYVVIHHTAQSACEQTLKTFMLTKTQVSAHYVICKDGTIHHMLNDYFRAWHAGVGKWGNLTDVNSASIGIELDNNGSEVFPESQIQSLVRLLGKLKKDYNIPQANFIGHSDIAPSRKVDPNAFFPWKKLSEQGFGYWPDAVLDSVPANFNSIHGLRMIGYDTKDSVAAIKAFKLHFIQSDLTPVLTDSNKMVIQNLVRKY